MRSYEAVRLEPVVPRPIENTIEGKRPPAAPGKTLRQASVAVRTMGPWGTDRSLTGHALSLGWRVK